MNRYDVLGLKADATPEDIKKAYRRLAAKTHPDVAGAVMAPLFLSVQDAYETLSDPGKRAAYDRELGLASAQQPKPAAYAGPQPASSSRRRDEAPQDYTAETPAASDRDLKVRRIRIGAVSALIAGLAGYWVFQEIQLWSLVQEEGPTRMYTARGVPAIAYAVLWTFSTLVAAVAHDLWTALKTPLGCAAISGAFAFITATGTPGMWIPALITGVVLTFTIAVTVRARNA